jgi:hypothetical protein
MIVLRNCKHAALAAVTLLSLATLMPITEASAGGGRPQSQDHRGKHPTRPGGIYPGDTRPRVQDHRTTTPPPVLNPNVVARPRHYGPPRPVN